MACLSRPAVAFYTGLSALAWNLLITLVGHLIGFQVEAMLDWMARYTTVAWSVILLVALAFGARHLWKRRQAR
jgi:membrane protein DedA with SNARE-associated domain